MFLNYVTTNHKKKHCFLSIFSALDEKSMQFIAPDDKAHIAPLFIVSEAFLKLSLQKLRAMDLGTWKLQ